MDIDPDNFPGAAGLQQLQALCQHHSAAGDIDTLRGLLLSRAGRTYEKHDIPRITAAAMLELGVPGVEELVRLVREAPGAIYPLAILETLWRAGSGAPVPRSTLGFNYRSTTVTAAVQQASLVAVDDLIMEAQTDGDLFRLVLHLAGSDDVISGTEDPEHPSPFSAHMMDAIRDTSIILTERTITEFEHMIAARLEEFEYQQFLEANPVFLDPLAAEVFNRHRLGAELVTDFVIRRHDWRYVVVEIEKPQSRVMTTRGDFAADFTHAIGQVLDFQGWVSSHVEYARTRMPLIETPSGMLVIGLRADLDESRQAKLRRWCANSRNIEVVTYDDLTSRARTLLSSLRRAGMH